MHHGRRAALAAGLVLATTGAAKRPPEPAAPAWDLLALVRRDAGRPATRTVSLEQLYGETRMAIATRVPDRVAYPVTIPPDAVLDLGWALRARAFMTSVPEAAVPTRFRAVLASEDGGEHVLLDRVIDLRGREADRRWFDERVDLARFAGVRGTLALDVSFAEEPGRPPPVTALFSAPRVLGRATAGDVSILLVTIDCLRADHVGAYGYARPTTPTIDRLAREGVRFARAYTNAPMTLPSLPQLFTSAVFPTPRQPTFLAPIGAAGIPSAAVVNNVWLVLWLTVGRDPHSTDGFDRLVSGEGLDARALTDRALEWLERQRDTRFALHVHYLDAHSPYTLFPASADVFGDPAYRGPVERTFDDQAGARAGRYDARDQARVVSLYDAGVRWADEHLGRLLEVLRRDGRLDRTVVVVTADHGEELWDHGGFFHGQSLYDELLHVPLVVRLPRAARAGTVVERPVRTIDIAPALLGWAGLAPPATLTGRSLEEALTDPGDPPDDLVATATVPQFPTRYALRSPPWKLVETIDDGSSALFDLGQDPGERRDVRADVPEVAAVLRERLHAARARLRETGFQVRVVAPDGGAVRIGVRLDNPGGTGSFTTLDRTAGPSGGRLALSRNGRVLRAKGLVDGRGWGFRFDRKLRRLKAGRGDVITLTVDAPGPAVLELGAAGHPFPDGRLDTLDPRLETATAPPCPPPAAGARVCVWRFPETLAPPTPAAPDAATRERLRALGYVE